LGTDDDVVAELARFDLNELFRRFKNDSAIAG
jgi:hypothetical protein